MDGTTQRAARQDTVSPRALPAGFAAVRIFFGAIWLSNGLAKVFLNHNSNVDWGFVSFNLINRPAAQSILRGASEHTFQPLRWIYQDVVLANWGFFQWLLTVAEVAAGISLVFGIAARLGAVIGILLVGPVWIMLLHSNLYFWEYPIDLFPLLVLAIVPAGRTFGQDGRLAKRFQVRWPF